MSFKILLVRSSSLGDLIHLLPAISDIAAHVPDAQIDFAVEEDFAEIPAWHPAVNQVITLAHRRWRKAWWSSNIRKERRAFKKELQKETYDMVLDMQGLMKSIWIVKQAKGERHGLDFKSVREYMAAFFYNKRYRINFWQPSVSRQRQLAAAALGYKVEGAPDFGLQQFTEQAQIQDYAVLMCSASRSNKLWDIEHWRATIKELIGQGLTVKLMSGSEAESQRAHEIAEGFEEAVVLDRMSLTDTAILLASCRIMIGLDSGITHLAAALDRPTIGIYCASTPAKTPVMGTNFVASLGDKGVPPSLEAVLSKINQALS